MAARSVAQARREQRPSLARDLHDFVAHDVSAIVVRAQAARVVAARDPGEALAALEHIEDAGQRALATMDRAVDALSAAVPDASHRREPERRDRGRAAHLARDRQDPRRQHPAQARRPQSRRHRRLGVGQRPHVAERGDLPRGPQGGLLTFGGAYTVVPFLQGSAVDGQGLAVQRAVRGRPRAERHPARPLIIFSTFVGYVAGGLGGALVMTLGYHEKLTVLYVVLGCGLAGLLMQPLM